MSGSQTRDVAEMMMNPKAILICGAVALAGCRDSAKVPAPPRADASEAIPIEERYHSITGLIHKGMSMAHARAILGDCTRGRFHGLLIDASSGYATNHEEWAWVLDSSNGQIVVHSSKGLESDMDNGVVARVSYARKFQAYLVTNETNTANTTSDGSRQPSDGFPKPPK